MPGCPSHPLPSPLPSRSPSWAGGPRRRRRLSPLASTAGQERGPARRRRPAGRPGRRDPGRQRRRPRPRPRPTGVSADGRRPPAPHRRAASRAWPTGLRQVAALPDPVGEVLDGWVRPNGLRIERVRVPLGVVAIIYENRPNVTSDAAGLCLKSGNAAFLRGSSGAHRARTSRSPRCCARRSPRPGCPRTRSILVEDTAVRGRRRVHAAHATTSTASSRAAARR